MGISKEKKALGYAVQDVKGDKLTQASSSNLSSAVCIPMYEICKVFAELGIPDNVNLPSTSVITPTVVPLKKQLM